MARQHSRNGGSTQNDYARKASLVEQVLGDPSLFPDTFSDWIVRWLYGNVNFLVTQGQLPQVEAQHLVGASGEVAFGGTTANFGGSNEPARYWKDPFKEVHIGGVVVPSAIPSTLWTLPAGYRPQYAHIFPVASNNAYGTCTINPDGTIVATSGSAVYFSLSGISFRQYA